MATLLEELVFSLVLDASKMESGVADVDKLVSSLMKKVEKSFFSIGKSIGKYLAPIFGAAAIKSAINDYVTTADALGDMAESLNMSGNELDSWSKAAVIAGSSAESLQNSFQLLGRQITSAVDLNMKRSQKVFDELGISLKNLDGTTKSTTDVLLELASIAETMDAQKFRGLASRIVDKNTLLFLQQGRAEVEKLVVEMQGLALTDEQILRAQDYQESLDLLGFNVRALRNDFVQALVPALNAFTRALITIVRFLREHQAFIFGFFTGLAILIMAKCLPAVVALGAAIWTAFAPLIAIAAPFIAVITSLALVFEDLWVHINGGETALANLWNTLGLGKGSIDQLKKDFVNTWRDIKAAATAFFDYFPHASENLKQIMLGLAELFVGIFTLNPDELLMGLKDIFEGLGLFIIEVFVGVWNAVSDLALAAFTTISDFIRQKISDAVASLPLIGNAGSEAATAFSGGRFPVPNLAARDAVPTGGAISSSQSVDQSTVNNVNATVTVNTSASTMSGLGGDLGRSLNNTLTGTGNKANKL